jgi:hypothetical protein
MAQDNGLSFSMYSPIKGGKYLSLRLTFTWVVSEFSMACVAGFACAASAAHKAGGPIIFQY